MALAAMEQWWAEEVGLRGEAAVADFEVFDVGGGRGSSACFMLRMMIGR